MHTYGRWAWLRSFLLESSSWCFHPKVTSWVWTFFFLFKQPNDWASLTPWSHTNLQLQPCNFYHTVVMCKRKKHSNSTMPSEASNYWHILPYKLFPGCVLFPPTLIWIKKTNEWAASDHTYEKQNVHHESFDESVSETTINILSTKPQWRQEISAWTTSSLIAAWP